MPEANDPAIKLFGKTISLPSTEEGSDATGNDSSALTDAATGSAHERSSDHYSVSQPGRVGVGQGEQKKASQGKLTGGKQEDVSSQQKSENSKDPTTSSGISENPKTPSVDRETSSTKSPSNGEQSEPSISQEKTLKKPDKILPCPRCNSMDTKFCYYNNYNVNQPRHFCKNCQRYWTAGGTMRNVPVGAGRRKNKHSSASHYRHIMVSEALQTARVNAANGIHSSTLGSNGTVLTFGSDAPLCESMASVLKLAEKTQNCLRNEFHQAEQRVPVSCGRGENGDDHSSGSCTTASNSTNKGGDTGLEELVTKNFQGFPLQVPCFPGAPWPFPWNSAQWSSAMPPRAFCPSGFPVSFYPTPTYWGCTVPMPWNVPWPSTQSSSPNYCAISSTPSSSPNLGKHSRDGNILKPTNSEKEESLKENSSDSDRGVWIPKTLRIDDPTEAAKSSIWATLGIKNEKTNSVNGGSLFKAFHFKVDEKNHMAETSPVLQANPAALSRSLKFHEST